MAERVQPPSSAFVAGLPDACGLCTAVSADVRRRVRGLCLQTAGFKAPPGKHREGRSQKRFSKTNPSENTWSRSATNLIGTSLERYVRRKSLPEMPRFSMRLTPACCYRSLSHGGILP